MLSVPCVIISALLLSGSLKYILNYSDVKKKKKKFFFVLLFIGILFFLKRYYFLFTISLN